VTPNATGTEADRPRARAVAERMRALESPVLRTFADPEPLVLERAEGSWLEDVDGQRYLDLSGLFAVSIVGHGHPRVVEAIREQATRLIHCPSAHPSRVRAAFLEAVAAIAPAGLTSIVPAMSGAMANELAVALARLRRPRGRIVSFSGSYFGRSPGVVALAGKAQYRDALGVAGDAQFLPFPYPLRMGPRAGERVMEQLEWLAAPGGGLGEIAAVMLEPIQGNGGVVIPPMDFLRRLRAFCDRTGALLIADEIQSGNGRTGRMWAMEHAGAAPDLMSVGKGIGGGMAVAALLGRPELLRGAPDAFSSTFLTNNVNLAAAVAAIGVLREDDLPARAARLGPPRLDALRRRLDGAPGVAEVRGLGLWFAVELADAEGGPDAERAGAVVRALRRRGVVVGRGGYAGQVVKAAPALTIAEADLDAGLDALADEILHGARS